MVNANAHVSSSARRHTAAAANRAIQDHELDKLFNAEFFGN